MAYNLIVIENRQHCFPNDVFESSDWCQDVDPAVLWQECICPRINSIQMGKGISLADRHSGFNSITIDQLFVKPANHIMLEDEHDHWLYIYIHGKSSLALMVYYLWGPERDVYNRKVDKNMTKACP